MYVYYVQIHVLCIHALTMSFLPPVFPLSLSVFHSLPPSHLSPSHLPSSLQHPTIDEPIEHGVAIIADTDTWTCKLMVATKDIQTK